MKKVNITLLFVFINILAFSQISQTAWDRNTKLGKGINTQGWLTHMHTTSSENYREYSESEFQLMKSFGFNHVRLKVDVAHWIDTTITTSSDTIYYTDSIILNHLDTGVSYCKNNDLITVINYYNWSWDSAMLNNSNYQQNAPIIAKQWKEIAQRYHTMHPDSLFYELYDEPGGVDETNLRKSFKMMIDSIRTIDTIHTIIAWHNMDDYSLLEDSNIILTAHFYQPDLFVNQGKTWGNNHFPITGVPFPYDSASMPPFFSQGNSYVDSLYFNYENRGSVGYVTDYLQYYKTQSDSLNAPLYIGEFGCIEAAPVADMLFYLKLVREEIEQHEFSWAYFNWQGGGVYDTIYKFRFFDCLGCVDIDSIFTDTLTGNNILCALGLDGCNISGLQEEQNSLTNLYPNPASDYIILSKEMINSDIIIYDINGKLIMKKNNIPNRVINIKFLESGSYIIFIKHKDSAFVQKLIKQ